MSERKSRTYEGCSHHCITREEKKTVGNPRTYYKIGISCLLLQSLVCKWWEAAAGSLLSHVLDSSIQLEVTRTLCQSKTGSLVTERVLLVTSQTAGWKRSVTCDRTPGISPGTWIVSQWPMLKKERNPSVTNHNSSISWRSWSRYRRLKESLSRQFSKKVFHDMSYINL